jgi:hypothetical protein
LTEIYGIIGISKIDIMQESYNPTNLRNPSLDCFILSW